MRNSFNALKGKLLYNAGIFLLIFLPVAGVYAQTNIRKDISLDESWKTVANDTDKEAYNGFEKPGFSEKNWKAVNVPHNWDRYEGYRRIMHGNRHGYSWYRKSFSTKEKKEGKRFFLWFEGVGSYATVFLNGKKVGYHAGGRTSFTLDVTDELNYGNKPNQLAVRADHPPHIQDLPWVCGGCSSERGFSEGSQPMGIFRPVHLIITNEVRIEPFGVHAWNGADVSEKSAVLNIETEVKNYSKAIRNVSVQTKVLNRDGAVVAESKDVAKIAAGASMVLKGKLPEIKNAKLWSPADPYLYSVVSTIVENGKAIDEIKTPYGIRWISWPVGKQGQKQFLVNGKPVFINGIAEYEHLIGESHAFSAEQVRSRVMQIKAAGFNAFRDAHQPHNLRYQEYWDQMGILWWTQMAAHVWYDTPEFRANFKTLLTDWVKERRNSPSVVLWGLENESTLPEEFARECTELIRKLDPTASSQRLVTTCNGGKGTDWDVPQNWTGTYGGDPQTYGQDVERQVLIGEYGAWRTLDLHTEGPFVQNGVYSEDRMTQLMETKVRLAEAAKEKTTGHFFWLLTSHDNPGRVQGGEGLRELDRVGPVNYKGLLTPWEEPLDVYYMYRSNYAPKDKEPMVYIVSHTWPDRWSAPGLKDSITVYSNCDEVELFNDLGNVSFGRRKRGGVGTHFQWDKVNVKYNVLYAVGYVNGKEAAKDYIVLRNLPKAPHFEEFFKDAKPLTAAAEGYNYLYRVNCGGADYKDENGNTWLADRQRSGEKVWGSDSWTGNFPGIPAFFASQRRTSDPVKGTRDWNLFQSFRYGRDDLKYTFPVADGEYLVELYFNEPWFGTGGGIDCTGWRIFDVAINNELVLNDLDIWKEAGHDTALKKTIKVKVKGGQLVVSFPEVKAGQAVIAGIAIASANRKAKPASPSASAISGLKINAAEPSGWTVASWMDAGDRQFVDSETSFTALPSNLYGAEWIRSPKGEIVKSLTFRLTTDADVFIGIAAKDLKPSWTEGYEDTQNYISNSAGQKFAVFRKRFEAGKEFSLAAGVEFDTQNYIIAVSPATNLEPAHDLKQVTSYKAVEATFKGSGLVKEQLMGKDRAIFKNAKGDVIEWTIHVGVADTYSLTLKYHNPLSRAMKGRIEVLAADGTVMKKPEDIVLDPTKEGKWNYLGTNTGTMINAGTYKVRFIADDAAGLSIDALDVQ